MDDRYRRELTKLHNGRPPADLWDRVLEGPRLEPLGPRTRSRVTAAVVAFAVFGIAAFLVWHAFRQPAAVRPAGSNEITVPARGETSAVFLADGRPVFVVHHLDGTVSVVDGFSSHSAWGVEDMIVWCPTKRDFVEAAHEARFDEYGGFASPPAPGGLATFAFDAVATDAAGDPSAIEVGDMQAGVPGGGDSGPNRAPFCPSGGGTPADMPLIAVTGGYTGDTGMVVAHSLDRVQIWDSPLEAVAAAPPDWVAVKGTLSVARDGFVQLCGQIVDGACDGGVVVRGIDGIGLRQNVTRFDWVSGYEEPQVWLVRIHDGVIDHPVGFGGFIDTWPGPPTESP